MDAEPTHSMIAKIRLALAATLGLVAGFAPAPTVLADPLPSGAYLAGRTASLASDFGAAKRYYTEAVARDPGNLRLLENALVAYVGLGDIDGGRPIARQLVDKGTESQLAGLVMLAANLKSGDFDAVESAFDAGASYSPLIDGLVRGWALLGQGRMSDASAQFDEVSSSGAMADFGQYHKALALAVVGDFEGADAILSQGSGAAARVSRGALVAHAQILSQLERNAEALEMLNDALQGASDPRLEALRDRIEAGETVAYDFITTAQDGAAEVFYALASALRPEASAQHTLLYARMAEYLRPDSLDILLLSAELLEDMGQFDLATATYDKVPRDHPGFYSAESGRAQALYSAGKPDAAVEVLKQLAKSRPEIPNIHISLGDMLRREERYEEAATAYDRALDLLPDPQPTHWFIYYARGIVHERIDDWPQAEADFRKALELSPGQPLVLNYLGYSLVEKREKLDEALAMIEQAVEARPNDGYITDSLGWVLYRLGRYAEAVVPMERAVELLPVDPIVNDHLGDVYWMVGRKLEAEFQWKRALSFDPEPEEEKRIRRKLEVGLDQVLEDEGEMAVSQNGN
ncbi:tetratricopeptide repeat protein [Rhodovulum sp. YNF3179]|uniref:tetratricopeptide repeat protein n=1 Tax=Rhodovulum sp. YNF3179 TaxID=3425127 RepID=UPI003D34265D